MKGHDLQAQDAETDRKRLLLERFQREVRPAALCCASCTAVRHGTLSQFAAAQLARKGAAMKATCR